MGHQGIGDGQGNRRAARLQQRDFRKVQVFLPHQGLSLWDALWAADGTLKNYLELSFPCLVVWPFLQSSIWVLPDRGIPSSGVAKAMGA